MHPPERLGICLSVPVGTRLKRQYIRNDLLPNAEDCRMHPGSLPRIPRHEKKLGRANHSSSWECKRGLLGCLLVPGFADLQREKRAPEFPRASGRRDKLFVRLPQLMAG